MYVGPTTMDCPQRCEVPAGAKLAIVPEPRHNWGDVVRCPNDGCGQCFLVLKAGTPAVVYVDEDIPGVGRVVGVIDSDPQYRVDLSPPQDAESKRGELFN